MTRKHFAAIAAALKATKPENLPIDAFNRSAFEAGTWDAWSATVFSVTDTVAQFNPNFDRDRFLTACGLFSAF